MDEFRRKILKLNEPRVHKVRNSCGVYDAYKWIRKNKWLNIGRNLTEHEFYTIIRQVNNLLAENLLRGNDITLPNRMGIIELRKYSTMVSFRDGKIITNLPIDWDKTLKLWAEDEESYNRRTLIRMEEKETFRIFYNRRNANYENKSFMQFDFNRDLKRRLKQRIKDRAVDAFKLQWTDIYH